MPHNDGSLTYGAAFLFCSMALAARAMLAGVWGGDFCSEMPVLPTVRSLCAAAANAATLAPPPCALSANSPHTGHDAHTQPPPRK